MIDTKDIQPEDYSLILGTSDPNDPIVVYIDKYQQMMYEHWDENGRWLGWKHETIATETEYFKRKLMGK